MPPRRRVRGNDGIGQGRHVSNAVLLEEIRHLQTRMEAMEISQMRDHDNRYVSVEEESYDEEAEEDTEEDRVLRMLVKAGGRLKVEVPMY